MKILISGATGLIGNQLGQALVNEGHDVHVLTRSLNTARLRLNFPCQIHEWNVSEEIKPSILNSVEAVFHLAGASVAQGRWTDLVKKSIYNSRVVGTRNLVKSIAKMSAPPKIVISSSAIGYYGERGAFELTEHDSAGKGFLSHVCFDWEREINKLNKMVIPSPRTSIVRTGVVLSDQGGALEKMYPIAREGLLGRLGSGNQWMSWIHISDLIRMMLWILSNKDARGIYNGVSSKPIMNKDFTRSLSRHFNKSPFLPVPSIFPKLALGEMSSLVLDSQRVLPKKSLDQGFSFKFSDLNLALKDVLPKLNRGENLLIREQWFDIKKNIIFDFFKSEKNLEEITPSQLGFKVISKSTEEIQKGTEIVYKLKIHGISVKWITLIKEFDEDDFFIDTQKKGPYKRWHHEHTFKSLGQGTLVKDRVIFKLPFYPLGALFAGWFVKKDVEKIFLYRKTKMHELFHS